MTRRQREDRARRLAEAEEQLRSLPPEPPPGKASDYIERFDHWIESHPGLPVALWCRVSARGQGRRGNPDDQESGLRRVVGAHGGRVAEVFPHVGPGWDTEALTAALATCRKRGIRVLLAETTDRFLRHPEYHSSENPDAQPTEEQFRQLARNAAHYGVTLLTHLHPDASPAEVRSYQSTRGQRAKGKAGGRPKRKVPGAKKQRREQLGLSKTFWLVGVGYSRREVAEITGVPPSTVTGWVRNRLGGGGPNLHWSGPPVRLEVAENTDETPGGGRAPGEQNR
jgi:DNA invertase Pin-like site-specific DNA recombinase